VDDTPILHLRSGSIREHSRRPSRKTFQGVSVHSLYQTTREGLVLTFQTNLKSQFYIWGSFLQVHLAPYFTRPTPVRVSAIAPRHPLLSLNHQDVSHQLRWVRSCTQDGSQRRKPRATRKASNRWWPSQRQDSAIPSSRPQELCKPCPTWSTLFCYW
jgi:hypothetical protein